MILTNQKPLFKNSSDIEVRISDHHSFIVTALKSELVKGNAKTKIYRNYKSFDINNFQRDLNDELNENFVSGYSQFHNIFVKVLNDHAPLKKKLCALMIILS